MTIESFRAALRAQPFQPFTIHMGDGRQLYVPHPDFAWLSPNGRTVIVHNPEDGSFSILDLLLMTELRVAAPGAAPRA
jgi:hypothetical protein